LQCAFRLFKTYIILSTKPLNQKFFFKSSHLLTFFER
jgi:hypothetical protein